MVPAEVRGESGLVVALVSGSHFINHMYLVILPPILTVLTGSFAVGLGALGVAMGVQSLVNTACLLPYGYLSDTRSRTLVLAACLGLGTLGVAIVAAAPSFAWLVVGQAVVGLGVAGHHPVHFPLLSDATPESYRGRAFSVHGFAGSLGFAAAPAVITGVLAAGYSWRVALGLLAGVGAVYGLLTVLALHFFVDGAVTRPALVEDGDTSGADGTGDTASDATLRDRVRAALASFRKRVTELTDSPAIVALAALALVSSTAAWGVTSYAAVFLENGYGVSQGLASLALTGMFVASAAMILVGGTLADVVSPGPVMVASYALVTLVVGVLASRALPALAAVGAVVLIGGVRSPSAPARSTLADRISERADLGQNFAAITVGIMLGSAIAPTVFGVVIERAGYRTAFFMIACIAALALGLTLWVLRRYGTTFAGTEGVPTPGDD
jgi:predicted MFS family arabinose efflux permease